MPVSAAGSRVNKGAAAEGVSADFPDFRQAADRIKMAAINTVEAFVRRLRRVFFKTKYLP
jgi:hypothetical protein